MIKSSSMNSIFTPAVFFVASFVVFRYIRSETTIRTKQIKLLLASTSKVKAQAVREAFGTTSSIVTLMDSESGIPEQPFGIEETFKGACNRLDSVRNSSKDFDFIVSIENGIVSFGENKFIDLAIVLCENTQTGVRECVTSAGIPFDAELSRISLFDKKQSVTVGSLLSEKYSSCDSKDPHAFLTNGEFSRKRLLVDALKMLKCLNKI